MPQAASHCPHRASIINDHLVWIRRDRKRVLVGPVEAGLKERLAEIATQSGFEILAVEVMPEPVHLLVSAPPKSASAEIVRWFKRMTLRSRTTSRTCPAGGPIDKANRPAQSMFSCVVCGYAGLADHSAAVNISRRAAVNPPIVARDDAKAVLTELRQSAVASHPL